MSDEELSWFTPLLDRPAVALDALGFYLAKLVWPAGLCAEYGRSPQLVMDSIALWPAALALALALGAALAFPERRRALCALAVFGARTAARARPRALRIPGEVDRGGSLRLRGAGRCGALRWRCCVRRYGTPAALGALGLALCCGLLSFAQAATWRDTRTLFGRVLESNPGSYAAHHNLAADAVLRRDFEFARTHFQRALEIDPSSFSALSNLAVCECELGRLDAGIEHLRQSIARRPGAADMRGNLVSALANKGQLVEAESAARELAALEPVDVRNFLPLARVLRVRGLRTEAAELLERVLARLPDWEPALTERTALGPP